MQKKFFFVYKNFKNNLNSTEENWFNKVAERGNRRQEFFLDGFPNCKKLCTTRLTNIDKGKFSIKHEMRLNEPSVRFCGRHAVVPLVARTETASTKLFVK